MLQLAAACLGERDMERLIVVNIAFGRREPARLAEKRYLIVEFCCPRIYSQIYSHKEAAIMFSSLCKGDTPTVGFSGYGAKRLFVEICCYESEGFSGLHLRKGLFDTSM